MPALRKPHRIAVLAPELGVDGADAANAAEAGLLLWIACIETCQRHPGLAVYDAEATPLISRDGHLAPQHARAGATPTDAFYGPTRRDELIWLQLGLSRPGAVQLHAVARDGTRQRFEATGDNPGRQIHQVLERWLAARGLGALPRPFEAATAGELLAAVRVIAPALAEQARASLPLDERAATSDPAAEKSTAVGGGAAGADSQPVTAGGSDAGGATLGEKRRLTRALGARVTATLRPAALRLLAFALREDLGDLILAADPDQPQALLEQFRATAMHGRDYGLLRRIIASAPGWARPYGELIGGAGRDPGSPAQAPPTELEAVAGAGIAALCRPDLVDAIETAADRLDDRGRVDEAVRLLERAVALSAAAAELHIALVQQQRRTDRRGAWLAQALRSAGQHGCPLDPRRPWYPDQIQIDLLVSDALERTGRLDEAIALRANRLEGRARSWPRHTRILGTWRRDPRFVARGYAREAHHRGDPVRTIEGFGRAPPEDAADVASLLDALVALGREDEVALVWAALGPGKQITEPVARLAAARGLLAAGDWRRGVEALWRVELCEPGRDEHAAIARCGRLLASAPLDVLEAAIGERVVVGAATLARRMARDIADFVPGAQASASVLRALGKPSPIAVDPAWFAGFPADTPSRRAIDALFAATGASDGEPLARADRLVNRWLEAVFTEASEDHPVALAQAAGYAAAQALARYLAATTAPPSPLAGGYRTVAAEALALVWRRRDALDDRSARAMLGALDPLLRRVDRWLGIAWLGSVERSCAIDERARGDVAGFARAHATVAARLLGPEEIAVLSASIARLHRERPDGWAAAVIAQAGRLAAHTGHAGAIELADAVAAQLAAGASAARGEASRGSHAPEPHDAIDLLHTACYLAEDISAIPCMHAVRLLLVTGRASAALAVLCAGLPAADPAWRGAQLAAIADVWATAPLDVPLAFDALASQLTAALARAEYARAEVLGKLAVAIDPQHHDAHRDLGIALAHQDRLPEALYHLTRGAPAQATQILRDIVGRTGKPGARALATMWSIHAEPAPPDGDVEVAPDRSPTLEDVVRRPDVQAEPPPPDGAASDPVADRSPTLDDVVRRSDVRAEPPPVGSREPAFQLLDAGDFAAATALPADPRWRIRRAALVAARHRLASENRIDVTPRARAAAIAVLADSAGSTDHEAGLARSLALAIREQAHFARDPVPPLGDRTSGEALRARAGAAAARPPAFVDRVAVRDSRIERVSDYVALLRDLAMLTPREALAQFDLDEAGYAEIGAAWGAAIAADPTLEDSITLGLAKR